MVGQVFKTGTDYLEYIKSSTPCADETGKRITIEEKITDLEFAKQHLIEWYYLTDYTCFDVQILTNPAFYRCLLVNPSKICILRRAVGHLGFLTNEDKKFLFGKSFSFSKVLAWKDVSELHHLYMEFFFEKKIVLSRKDFFAEFQTIDRSFCNRMEEVGPKIPTIPLYSEYTEDSFVEEVEFTYYAARAYFEKFNSIIKPLQDPDKDTVPAKITVVQKPTVAVKN